MAGNKGNRPLMIYTSLIFIVAIIMVVVAYFGQKHLESTQIRQTETAMGISERASQLSDENRLLMEMNSKLSSENAELTTSNEQLTAENAELVKQNEANSRLLEVYMTIYNGSKSNARKLLQEIYSEDLTADQKDFYDALVKLCK